MIRLKDLLPEGWVDDDLETYHLPQLKQQDIHAMSEWLIRNAWTAYYKGRNLTTNAPKEVVDDLIEKQRK